MVLKEIYDGIKRQFAPPCEKYMYEIVDELREMGVTMETHCGDHDSSAYGGKERRGTHGKSVYYRSPILLHISHDIEGGHTGCGIWAKIRFSERGERERPLPEEIGRKYWGLFYNDKEIPDEGLKLRYPEYRGDKSFMYIEPHRLAQDIRNAIRDYEETRTKP